MKKTFKIVVWNVLILVLSGGILRADPASDQAIMNLVSTSEVIKETVAAYKKANEEGKKAIVANIGQIAMLIWGKDKLAAINDVLITKWATWRNEDKYKALKATKNGKIFADFRDDLKTIAEKVEKSPKAFFKYDTVKEATDAIDEIKKD